MPEQTKSSTIQLRYSAQPGIQVTIGIESLMVPSHGLASVLLGARCCDRHACACRLMSFVISVITGLCIIPFFIWEKQWIVASCVILGIIVCSVVHAIVGICCDRGLNAYQ